MVLAGHPTREAPAHAAHAIFQQVGTQTCTACNHCLLLSSKPSGHVAAAKPPVGVTIVPSENWPKTGQKACLDRKRVVICVLTSTA